jgi:hypothetical protein
MSPWGLRLILKPIKQHEVFRKCKLKYRDNGGKVNSEELVSQKRKHTGVL